MGEGGVYTMENKDTNTDYQKVVTVGDQNSETVEITIGIICLRFVFTIFYTGSFQVPPEKNYPYPKSQFDLSSSYINLLKNGSTPSITQRAGVQTMATNVFTCIFYLHLLKLHFK